MRFSKSKLQHLKNLNGRQNVCLLLLKCVSEKKRKRAVERYRIKTQMMQPIYEMMGIIKPALDACISEEQTTQKAKLQHFVAITSLVLSR